MKNPKTDEAKSLSIIDLYYRMPQHEKENWEKANLSDLIDSLNQTFRCLAICSSISAEFEGAFPGVTDSLKFLDDSIYDLEVIRSERNQKHPKQKKGPP